MSSISLKVILKATKMNWCKNRSNFVYFAAASVNLMSAVAGMGYAWPSPFIPKLNGDVDPDKNPLNRPTTLLEDSWLGSLQSLGAILGPLMTGTLSNWLGKKRTIMLFSIPYIASSIMMMIANTVWHFYVARLLVGIGTGCVFSLIPLYVAEISEVHQRGVTSTMMALIMVTIQFFTYVLAPVITVRSFGLFQLVPSTLFLIIFGIFIPESPYQLVLSEKLPEAERALAKFRSKGDVCKELLEISKDIEMTQEKTSIISILKSPSIRKSLTVAIGLLFFQQFSGILPIISYMQTIFDESNGPISGDKAVMLVGFIQILAVGSLTFLVNSIGRKKLLLFSHFGITLSLLSLGCYFFFQVRGYTLDKVSWLPVVSICCYILFFNAGLGAIPWTIIGEIFPSNLKSYLSSVATITMLLTGFLIALIFPTLSLYLGMHGLMWMFAGFVICGAIFIIMVVPETKDKSFVEIQNMLQRNRKT